MQSFIERTEMQKMPKHMDIQRLKHTLRQLQSLQVNGFYKKPSLKAGSSTLRNDHGEDPPKVKEHIQSDLEGVAV